MDRKTLTITQAREAVGVSKRTIYNWLSAGKVEYVRTAGGGVRIFADSLWRSGSERPSNTQIASVGDQPVGNERKCHSCGAGMTLKDSFWTCFKGHVEEDGIGVSP